jgi:sulfur-carrier protein adenylyltransferase/sulfurtransferase
MLNSSEISRYQKHLFLPEIGQIGQEKLKAAKVLVVGAGGLGCPVLQYLAAAGIGTLGIIDGDKVELSNLQRQVIYTINDIRLPKANSAAKHLNETNNLIDYQVFEEFLSDKNAETIIAKFDIIVDCTDNFTVRYLINDSCVKLNKPFVYGAIHKFEGQVAVFNFTDKNGNLGPTYRCVFPNQPSESEIPNCATVGVLGILPGIVGTFQANEVIKMILGIGKVLSGEMLLVDLLENTSTKIKIKRILSDELGLLNDAIKIEKPNLNTTHINEISVNDLNKRLLAGDDIKLIDVRNEFEFGICGLPNAQLIPLNDIENKVNQIPTNKQVVLFCHHGMRSAHAIKTLQRIGEFNNLINLSGGIDAWAREIDEKMERY